MSNKTSKTSIHNYGMFAGNMEHLANSLGEVKYCTRTYEMLMQMDDQDFRYARCNEERYEGAVLKRAAYEVAIATRNIKAWRAQK